MPFWSTGARSRVRKEAVALLCLAALGEPAGAQAPTTTTTANVQAALPAPAPDADKVSLSQAVNLGLRQNPQIAASLYSVESARQNYNSQRAPINPTLNYAQINNTVAPLDWTSGFSQGANYSVYATIETNGAIRYRAWQARDQWRQAQFDAAAATLSLKLGIINAYIGLQVANRTLEVELQVYDNIRRLTELTQRRFEIGAGPQADATRAKIAEIQEEQNVITDAGNVKSARATLNQQLGRPQTAPVDVAEPLVYHPVSFPALSELLQEGERERPELKSAIASLSSLRAVPGLQRSAYYPNVILATDFGGDGLFVGASIPVDLGSIRGSVSKADADIKTQKAQVEVQRQSINLDVKSSYVNFEAAQKQVDTYNSGILSMSQTLLDEVRHGYELGANTIVDIITAENTYRSVESSYYAAVGTYVEAAFALKHSIGELPDNLPFADIAVSPGSQAARSPATAAITAPPALAEKGLR